jgi:hypothetical protein
MTAPTYPVHAYPVRVDASLDEHLSRGLWLVKWLLAIPHYIVLALLWIAFMVLSVVAGFAILFTGRYPRGIFDFNVGVLRWSWRVSYYSYGGLGTDRYPPFSLAERPDYPAHLEIAYPDHLSRGLVLVKWWLLAIPHYIVLGIFLGGGWYAAESQFNDDTATGSIGLITLLVLVAAVVLLFTGRYPRSVFDLVLGLNRWVLRVAAYAALMTDDYPPFRLDMGGADPNGSLAVGRTAAPAGPPATPPTPAAGAAAPYVGGTSAPPPTEEPTTGAPPGEPPGPTPPTEHRAPSPRTFGPGRVVAIVLTSLLVLVSLGLLGSGLALRIADDVLRDDRGFLMTDRVEVSSPGYAVVSESLEVDSGTEMANLPERWLGEVTMEADALTDEGVFLGVARTALVDRYLDGVAHSTVVDPGDGRGSPVDTTFVDGGSPRVAPTDADFWVASASGPGRQEIVWDASEGDWTLVVMNGEGTTPVRADVAVGAEVPVLRSIAVGFLVAGGLLLLVSIALLIVAAEGSRRSTA